MAYYDNEDPVILETDKNKLSWYPEAGKLNVARPDWVNDEGQTKPGKTVVLDLNNLADTPGGIEFLENIIASFNN